VVTAVLEVGMSVGSANRIVSLRWLKSRGWRAKDSTGASYYQRGPGHGTTGPSFADGLVTVTPVGSELTPWPPPEGQGRKRMRPTSPTNKRWNAPGRARPDEPLADVCEAAIPGVCKGRPTDRHHIIPRGPGSSDEAWNTLDVCGTGCHRHIHRHGAWARERGFLRRAGAS